MTENDLFNFDKLSQAFQPVSFNHLYGTTFYITAKADITMTGGKTYLNSLTLRYNRLAGTINFSLHDFQITREINGSGRPEIYVKVYLRAFARSNNPITRSLVLGDKFEIYENDFLHIDVQSESDSGRQYVIVDLNLQDDITYLDEKDDDVICYSRII